jgi:plastocyanin
MKPTLLVVSLALAACGEDPTGPTGPVETRDVLVLDNAFEPPAIRIAEADTVTWTWAGIEPHTVTFDDPGLLGSPVLSGGTHRVQFESPGTFTYFCSVHGREVMAGSVEVVPGQVPQP